MPISTDGRCCFNMSTGQSSQAGHQKTTEKGGSESALLYLFQEVSKLGSPVHSSVPDIGTLSSWQSVDEMKYGARLLQTSSSPFLPPLFERDENMATEVKTQVAAGAHSPWRVLSLINLQCNRLMDPNVRPLSSAVKSVQYSETAESFECARKAAPVAAASACIAPTDVEEEEHFASKSFNQSKAFSSQIIETNFSVDMLKRRPDADHLHGAGSSLSPNHVPHTSSSCQIDFDIVDLSKPPITLDHNANIMWQRHAQHSPSKPGDKNMSSKSESTHDAIEEKPHHCHSQKQRPPTSTVTSEQRPKEGNDPLATCHGPSKRAKIPRKQPKPSRSVNIQDPNLQGVMFRMDTGLDGSGEQCRLLITSKYSKECHKKVRRPRTRNRTSQMTSSSEEEANTQRSKVCASCCTTTTPMWRDAEDGTPLCNACGIRYKKYRVRCHYCWHIPRKESNSSSHCLKCGNLVKVASTQHKHNT
ncbi:GATA-type zinc finger protein 1 isoform X2 [Nerophis lumbriciformis]|uniref:GATA-type zinc finger protein 1 isoform X2 n=1 Tax=Nerophis lumbriciformis TaxID=546530 RepID=UPI002AE09395|nr:GATA-type zinc finger protein 1 isoform X2 [Nerophis lumbriciformis]